MKLSPPRILFRRHTIGVGVGLLVALLAVTACTASSDGDTAEATTTTEASTPEDPVDTVEPVEQAPPTVAPLPSYPPPTGPASAAAAGIVAVSGLNDAEIACLVDAVAADPQLHAALEDDPAKESPGGLRALAIADQCRSDNTGAALFANEAQRQNGGTLTDQQIACLTNGYRQLTPDDLQEMLAGAVDPANADTDTIAKVETIYTDCNVEP